MRRVYLFAFPLLTLWLTACTATKPPVGLTSRSEIDGRVRQTVALRIGDSPSTEVATVLVQGKGTLTVSTDVPHVVADGDLVIVEESTMPAGWVVTRSKASIPGAVTTSQALPGGPPAANAPVAAPSCSSGWCPVEAAPVAAPTPACAAGPLPTALSPLSARPCGTPVYVGCDGTVGGHRPTSGPTYKPMPPCDRPVAMTTAQKVALAPAGLVACVVKGLVGMVQCILSGPGL